MGKKRASNLNVLYSLLVLVILLQAVAIGLVIRFEDSREKRDVALLDRTDLMLNDIFPGIRSDLSAISEKASEIKKDVLGLQDSVAKVDERVGVVGDSVAGVGGQVDGLNQRVTGFFQDKSGLIWGHSLNPYVLGLLLLLVLLSIPVLGWILIRKHPPRATAEQALVEVHSAIPTPLSAPSETFVLEPDNDQYLKARPELRKIMEETERLIDHARHDGDAFRRKFKSASNRCSGNPDLLN
jgi:hypothetical protein